MQQVTSVNVSPYLVKGTDEGLGVLVGWGVDVGLDEPCSDEQAKRRNANVITNRSILVLPLLNVLISLLLADRVL